MSHMTHGRACSVTRTCGVACWGEPRRPLMRNASKNTRERMTEGVVPRPVTSFSVLSVSGNAGPERDMRACPRGVSNWSWTVNVDFDGRSNINIYTDDGNIHTDVYAKPINKYRHLYYSSFPPFHTKLSIPFSLGLRLRRFFLSVSNIIKQQTRQSIHFFWRFKSFPASIPVSVAFRRFPNLWDLIIVIAKLRCGKTFLPVPAFLMDAPTILSILRAKYTQLTPRWYVWLKILFT